MDLQLFYTWQLRLFSVTSSDFRNTRLVFDTGASITSISPGSILGLGYDSFKPKV